MATGQARTEWARYLAAMGWHVFPLVPASKRPAVKDWENRATTDADRVARCWQAGDFNIGLATGPSRLVVIDLDTGPDVPGGAEALARLTAERGGSLPATYTVATPSGGTHLYFTAPAGVHLRNTARTLGPRIDTRAEGGYVVAPGSMLDNGGYELVDDTDAAELPAWLVQAIAERPSTAISAPAQIAATRRDAYAASAVRGECERVRNAPSGRHNAVLSYAAFALGQLAGGGLLDEDTARTELLAAGQALITNECGCTPREVARVIDAGLTAGARKPRGGTGTAGKEAA
jgi:hypothetical protein